MRVMGSTVLGQSGKMFGSGLAFFHTLDLAKASIGWAESAQIGISINVVWACNTLNEVHFSQLRLTGCGRILRLNVGGDMICTYSVDP